MLLRIWLTAIGLVCAGIGLAHLFFGSATIIGGGPVSATVDSELRFYAVVFIAYGWGFVWAAADIPHRAWLINALGVVFLIGGLARFLSIAAVGVPDPFYLWMIPVEIGVPVVNYVMLRRLASSGPPTSRMKSGSPQTTN
jgi:hypothetical protein